MTVNPTTGISIEATALSEAIRRAQDANWLLRSFDVASGSAVMYQPAQQGANHVLHALLSFFTMGLWLPVWALVAATTRPVPERTLMIQVYSNGYYTYQ